MSSGLRARSRLHDDYSDNDQEESEYESDGDEGNVNKIYSDHEDEYEEEDDEDEVRGVNAASEDDEEVKKLSIFLFGSGWIFVVLNVLAMDMF